jgi:hypothetical protein
MPSPIAATALLEPIFRHPIPPKAAARFVAKAFRAPFRFPTRIVRKPQAVVALATIKASRTTNELGRFPAQLDRLQSEPHPQTGFARSEAGRHPGRAADQICSRHQFDDRQGARSRRAAVAARPRDARCVPCHRLDPTRPRAPRMIVGFRGRRPTREAAMAAFAKSCGKAMARVSSRWWRARPLDGCTCR